MNAAIYAYKNCDGDAGKEAIKAQINSCISFANDNNYIVDKEHIYTDLAISGSLFKREGLNHLQNAAAQGEFCAVIVDDLSRVTRSLFELNILIRDLHSRGIQLVSVADSQREQCLISEIKHLINKAYIDDLRRKTKRKLIRKSIWPERLKEGC